MSVGLASSSPQAGPRGPEGRVRVRRGASSRRTGTPALGPEDGETQTLVWARAGISLSFPNCTGTGLVRSRQGLGGISAALLPGQEHYTGQALNPLSIPPSRCGNKAQTGYDTCLRSHSKGMAELGFKPGLQLWLQ